MTHPAIDGDEVAALRRQVADPDGPPVEAVEVSAPVAPSGSVARLKGAARRAAVPVVARLRKELVAASAGDQADLRAQVADLRAELARTRAEHAAELAALHEELAARRRDEAPST